MTKMTKIVIWLIMLLIVGLLTGCTSSPPAQEEVQLESLLIFDGETMHTLKPADAAYAPVAEGLDNLIAGIDVQARTFYTAERFDEELAFLPRLEATYDRDITLMGEVNASHFVVVIPDGDMLILTQKEGETTWGVYLNNDTARFEALIETLKSQTSVDLQADGSQ